MVPLDLPGNGVHSRVRVPTSVLAMVDFVRADLMSRGYTPPFRLIALSLGAMVAIAWAQRRSREIERLVLINTSMRPFSGPLMRLRPRALPELLVQRCAGDTRRDVEAAIHSLTCNRRDKRDMDLAAWSCDPPKRSRERANALRQLWAAARFRADDAPPHCPLLVLSSRGDKLVTPVALPISHTLGVWSIDRTCGRVTICRMTILHGLWMRCRGGSARR